MDKIRLLTPTTLLGTGNFNTVMMLNVVVNYYVLFGWIILIMENCYMGTCRVGTDIYGNPFGSF